jgi:hypothetical protein
VRDSIGFTFVQRAQLQDNFNLRDLIDGFGRIPLFKRMHYSIFKVLLELKIANIESFKIVVEVEARKHFTYLGPRGFRLDRCSLNLFLQLSVSELLLKLVDLQIFLTLSTL